MLDAAAPTGGAPYKTWQSEQFLKSLLTVCEAITTAPIVPRAENRAEENAADLDVSQIDWTDTQRLKENIRAVIHRLDVHPFDRWFKVTLFDGREVIYREAGDEIEIMSSESTALVAPEGTVGNSRSRRRSS